MRILLLNPPADETVIRDYYCSKTTKSNYLFPPIDLVMQSGILAQEHEVHVLDAIVERLGIDQTIQKIAAFKPEIIIGLIGAVRRNSDLQFYRLLKEREEGAAARIFLSGDAVLENGETFLQKNDYIEGLLLRFISDGLYRYLRGEEFHDLLVRGGGGISKSPDREYRVPLPRHELFIHPGYRFSFARGRRFATVLTDFGCPYKCGFCVMGTLGLRLRPLDDVLEELKHLSSLGIREFFFCDQCFGAARERSIDLCRRIADELPGIGFTTFTRPDLLDDDLIRAMKAAGAHTLIMGVESAEYGTLEKYHKQTTLEKVSRGFALCRENKIRSAATFIIGLPGDTKKSIGATMRLARELDPDFVSYNVAVPRECTPLRAEALAGGLLDPDADMDQAGAVATMDTAELSRGEVAGLKKQAVRDFYLRPAYLLRHLRTVTSLADLLSQGREGLALIRRNL